MIPFDINIKLVLMGWDTGSDPPADIYLSGTTYNTQNLRVYYI